MVMRKRKGLSEVVGFLILLMIVIVALVPLAIIMFSQPSTQQQQIENAQVYKNLAIQQYQDLVSGKLSSFSNSSMPPVEFLYKCNGYVLFVFTTTQPPPVPLEIKYLEVYNGTQWVILQIVKQGNMYVAVPTNQVPTSGISVAPNDTNAYYDGYPAILIKLPLSAIPYHNQAQYVKAVTQYGDVVTSTQAMPDCYVFMGGYLTSSGSIDYDVTYYNSSVAPQYWRSVDNLNYNFPVLALDNGTYGGGYGFVFWNQFYNGKSISITFIGIYYNKTQYYPPADGFEVYLFLRPTMWNVSPVWNETLNLPGTWNAPVGFPIQGAVFFPQSPTPYIIVQWDPWANYGWNIWIVNNTDGSSAKAIYATGGLPIAYDAPFGTNPSIDGHLIILNITYNSITNTLYGLVYDVNLSKVSAFVLQLPNNFTAPTQGYYTFGIGSQGGGSPRHWGIVYANVTALEPLFDPQLASLFSLLKPTDYIFESSPLPNNQVTYYNQSNAYQYWELAYKYNPHNIVNNNTPVLQFTQTKLGYDGAVYWSQYWTPNQSITTSFIGTFTNSTTYPNSLSDGFAIEFLLKPTAWSISPYWNESTNLPASILPSAVPNQGTIESVQSSTPYIIVQYQPYYYYSHSGNGSGMWNVYIVTNPAGSNPQVIAAWGGIGHGFFLPNPGDFLVMSVTYNPSTNMIYGIVKDINTGQESVLVFHIPYNDYKPPTEIGNYTFAIQGLNGGYDGNWALVYANVSVLEPLFDPQMAYVLDSVLAPQLVPPPLTQPPLQYIFEENLQGNVEYFNSTTAPNWWKADGLNLSDPVLQLNKYIPGGTNLDGMVFWNQSYYYGESYTFSTIFVTANSSGEDFFIYLFLNPTLWNINKYWNFSSSFPIEYTSWTLLGNPPRSGIVPLPQSATPYIVVEWDTYYWNSNYTGEWNVWVINNEDGNTAGYTFSAFGVTSGKYWFNPGDFIYISVTYDPSTNTIYGIAVDLNHTSWVSTLEVQIPDSVFTPPASGYYIFGIGSDGWPAAEAIIYASYSGLQPLFSPVVAKYLYGIE